MLPRFLPHTCTQQPTPTSTPLFAEQNPQTASSPTHKEQDTAQIDQPVHQQLDNVILCLSSKTAIHVYTLLRRSPSIKLYTTTKIPSRSMHRKNC